MKKAVEVMKAKPKSELIWASPRELLNVFQADAVGCHIITATNDILKKLSLVGKDNARALPPGDYLLSVSDDSGLTFETTQDCQTQVLSFWTSQWPTAVCQGKIVSSAGRSLPTSTCANPACADVYAEEQTCHSNLPPLGACLAGRRLLCGLIPCRSRPGSWPQCLNFSITSSTASFA
jgi:hypothetical protein